jgi:hypothetical protein
MKVYLTTEEFANLFWELFERRMSKYNPNASQCDRILWNLFQDYETVIKETLEGAMWNIDEFEGENAADLIGYQFHKTFRQTDVIDDKHIDGVIWSCMQDAPVFWRVMNRACKILASADAAELYKEEV